MFRTSPDQTAQLAHFGWGALIVLILALFGHPVIGGLIALGWALIKETIDVIVNHDSISASLRDVIFWLCGILLSLTLLSFWSYR